MNNTFTNYVVIGAGGIGHFLAPNLAKLLSTKTNSRLIIVDGDDIEDKNLERVYGPGSVGRKKAHVLASMCLEGIRPGSVNIVSIAEYISPDTFYSFHQDWFVDNTVIFGCVDNNKTRVYLETLAKEKLSTICLILGGNDYLKGQSQLWLRNKGVDVTPLITDFAPELTIEDTPGNFFPDDPDCTQEYESEPQLVLTNSIVAATMLNMLYSEVWNKEKPEFNEILVDVGRGGTVSPFYRRSLKQRPLTV